MTSLVGEKAVDQTPPVWPVWVQVPSVVFQIRAVWSRLAVARWVPSGENTTVLMGPVCPVRVRSRVPV